MSHIKEWNPTDCGKVKREILARLQPLFEEYGIQPKASAGTYVEDSFGFKLELRVKGSLDPKQKALETYARYSNLDTERVVNIDGHEMKLWGYNTRARKTPWVVEDQNGRGRYKLSKQVVVKYFAKQ